MCVLCLVGFLVSDSERLSGGDVSRQPDRDPVHGEQLRRVTDHGEGVHEGRDEDQGGRLPGRVTMLTQLFAPLGLSSLHFTELKEAQKLPIM